MTVLRACTLRELRSKLELAEKFLGPDALWTGEEHGDLMIRKRESNEIEAYIFIEPVLEFYPRASEQKG